MIIGSGFLFHNFDYFFAKGAKLQEGIEHGKKFSNYLRDLFDPKSSVLPEERLGKLKDWEKVVPSANKVHPVGKVEHFIPFLVCAAAAEGKACTKIKFAGNTFPIYNFEF